jgi:hypothetical protein
LARFIVHHFDLIMLRADAMRNPISRMLSYGVGEHGLFQNWGSERGGDG